MTDRIPPGQIVTTKWPVLHYGNVPKVDTKTWTIIKEIQGIGPDLQTPALTYDGKYLITPFSGFQRQQSGISVIDTSTDTLIGILPSNGGHHDCAIIPTKLEHMKNTRSCTPRCRASCSASMRSGPSPTMTSTLGISRSTRA